MLALDTIVVRPETHLAYKYLVLRDLYKSYYIVETDDPFIITTVFNII